MKYLIMREVVKGLGGSDAVFYRTDEPNTMQGLKADSATVKINNYIYPFVIQLKGNLKKGSLSPDILQNLFNVLNGKNIANNANFKFVQKYDDEHRKAVSIESENRLLKSNIKSLEARYEQLEHKDHDCQALIKTGARCTKPAKFKASWQGIELNVCTQHFKKVT